MTDLAIALRTGSSPARQVPDGVAVAINNSSQAIGAATAGARRVLTRGAIVAAADATVTLRTGSASGTILATIPLVAGQAMPLSIWAAWSEVGEALYLVTTDAVAITGRAVTELA